MLKTSLKISLVIFFFVIFPNLALGNSISSIKNDIDGLISQFDLPATIGIEVQSMQTGNVLYKKNPQHLFIPASNLKLFTAVASLLYLKPNYQYQTLLMTDANQITNDTLSGNLYIKFSGDPTLKTDQLNELISTLKTNNIKTIAGNLYIDNSRYNDKQHGPGWMWDELNICYAAPIQAIMLDQNCFEATLTPADNAGQLTQLSIPEKYNSLVQIQNQAQTVAFPTDNCQLELIANNNNQYVLSGCMPLQAKPINLSIAIKNPVLYIQTLMARTLQQNGIQLKGKILNTTANSNLKILATHNSESLALIVKEMMKDSNDQIANSLLMTMGEAYYKQPGTWKNGVNAMQSILTQQTPIKFVNSNIVDGSGISRYNLVSPQQIAQLLYFAYHNPTISPAFIDSLPIAGKDGTLKDRMTSADIRGRLIAKTGSMTSISALSGYVTTAHHKKLSFVILINNFSPKETNKAQSLENEIGKFLAKT